MERAVPVNQGFFLPDSENLSYSCPGPGAPMPAGKQGRGMRMPERDTRSLVAEEASL
jgi:hypothetical protein